MPTDVLAALWLRMTELFGFKWTSQYGESHTGSAGATWRAALVGVPADRIAVGLGRCITEGDGWPPNVVEFRAKCLDFESELGTFAAAHAEVRRYYGWRNAGNEPCAFTWNTKAGFAMVQDLDGWKYRNASEQRAEKMARESYDRAVQRYRDGHDVALPEVTRLEHDKRLPRTEAGGAAALEAARAALEPLMRTPQPPPPEPEAAAP